MIHTLPIIRNLYKLENKARDFGFIRGTAAETSGGLLVAVKDPDAFLRDYKQIIGNDWGWVIGEVVESESDKKYSEIINPKIIEI